MSLSYALIIGRCSEDITLNTINIKNCYSSLAQLSQILKHLFELSKPLTNRFKSNRTVLIIQAIIPGVLREVRAVTLGVAGRPCGAPEVRGGRNGVPELGGPRACCAGVS